MGYACHTSELGGAGDFVAFEIAGESLFAVRDGDGTVRTFYNVCMHRGHQLVEGRASRKLIVCPYHAWTYRPDGQLHKAQFAHARRAAGLASRGYRPGPLILDPDMGINSEHTVAAIKAWYQEAMLGER